MNGCDFPANVPGDRKIAVSGDSGAGGVHGVGLGEGRQKMFYLPEAHTDFIFAVVGEETGLWGTAGVLGLFVVLGFRGVRIAIRHPQPFGRLLAFGCTFLLVGQAGFNMAVALGLLPTKGLPLPRCLRKNLKHYRTFSPRFWPQSSSKV